jgi:hypothetical protein
VVERLEAEQEKFILGITKPYRAFLKFDDQKQVKKLLLSIENFIVAVNNIHLQQVAATASEAEELDEEKRQEQNEEQGIQKAPDKKPVAEQAAPGSVPGQPAPGSVPGQPAPGK